MVLPSPPPVEAKNNLTLKLWSRGYKQTELNTRQTPLWQKERWFWTVSRRVVRGSFCQRGNRLWHNTTARLFTRLLLWVFHRFLLSVCVFFLFFFHLRCRVSTAIPVVPLLPEDGDQTISASSCPGCATADALPLCCISTFIFFFFSSPVRQNRMIKARPIGNQSIRRWCLYFSSHHTGPFHGVFFGIKNL